MRAIPNRNLHPATWLVSNLFAASVGAALLFSVLGPHPAKPDASPLARQAAGEASNHTLAIGKCEIGESYRKVRSLLGSGQLRETVDAEKHTRSLYAKKPHGCIFASFSSDQLILLSEETLILNPQGQVAWRNEEIINPANPRLPVSLTVSTWGGDGLVFDGRKGPVLGN